LTVFSALFHSRFTSILSADSEIFSSNTFGNRVGFFFTAAFKAINSCAFFLSGQPQAFLRLNSEYVSNEIVIDEIWNSVDHNSFKFKSKFDENSKSMAFEEINSWSIQFQKKDAGNHDEFGFKRFN
jgi:hypothetical protein